MLNRKTGSQRLPLQFLGSTDVSPYRLLEDRHVLASSRSRLYGESMNWKIVCILAALSLALNGTVFAAGAETYQITGTVVEATGSKVTVEKGTERFEFDIDPATMKGSAELKVGSTVTVTYVMSATKIEAASQAPSSQSSP